MKSIQHVLRRGALALGLLAVGIGSGLGMPPIRETASRADRSPGAHALVAENAGDDPPRPRGIRPIAPHRALTPAG